MWISSVQFCSPVKYEVGMICLLQVVKRYQIIKLSGPVDSVAHLGSCANSLVHQNVIKYLPSRSGLKHGFTRLKQNNSFRKDSLKIIDRKLHNKLIPLGGKLIERR